MLQYKPYSERIPDNQYRELLETILDFGQWVDSQQEEKVKRIFGYQMRFNLENGFPIITERDLISKGKNSPSNFEQSLAELIGFLNGARTQSQLTNFGCTWWKRWVTKEKCNKRGLEEGDLGPGSYGAAWRNFPTSEGAPFDQIINIIEQLQELPHLRTHFISPWIPQYISRGKNKIQKVVVAPCHGWIHILTNVETGELSLHHFQRSADVPVGLVCNMIQYAALTMMFAHVLNYKAKNLIYTLSDAHIFEKQEKAIREILFNTQAMPLPTVRIAKNVDSIFDFRVQDFEVTDYYPQTPRRIIWTPV